MNTLSHINNILLQIPTKSDGRYVRFELYDEANTLIYVGRVWVDAGVEYQTVNITDIIRSYKPIVNDANISAGGGARKNIVKKFYVKTYETDGTFIAETAKTSILMVYPLPSTMSADRTQFEQFTDTKDMYAGVIPCLQHNKYDGRNWRTQTFDVYPRYPMNKELFTPKTTLYYHGSRALFIGQYNEADNEDATLLVQTSTFGNGYTYSMPRTEMSSTQKALGVWTSQQGYSEKYKYIPQAYVTFHLYDNTYSAQKVSDVMIDYNDKYTVGYIQNTAYQSIHHGIGQQFILHASTKENLVRAIERIESQLEDNGVQVLEVEYHIVEEGQTAILYDSYESQDLYGWHVTDEGKEDIAKWVMRAFGVDDYEAMEIVQDWVDNSEYNSSYMEVWDEGFYQWVQYTKSFPEYRALEDELVDYTHSIYDLELTPIVIENEVRNYMKVADLDECPSKYYLMWEDRFGGAFCYPFSGKETRSLTYNRTNIEDQYGAQRPAILQNNTTFELNSGWLSDKHMEVFESIMVSPWLSLYDTERDLKFNVIVEDKNYTIKTRKNQGKKMYNFSVKLKINTAENIVY